MKRFTLIAVFVLFTLACGFITGKAPPTEINVVPAATDAPTDAPILPSESAADLPQSASDDQQVPMNLVPAGAFTMGARPEDYVAECEKFIAGDWCKKWAFPQVGPVHQVTLDSFYIDLYEVTNARYKVCVDAKACAPPQDTSSFTHESYYGNSEFDNYPVIHVDWRQANIYCEWRGGRLPTEAEWEKSARGTDGRTYPWGSEEPNCDRGAYRLGDMDSTEFCTKDTAEVGSYPTGASPYGVLDMGGNVSEWTADWFEIDYYAKSPASNPQGPVSGAKRVVRGGTWGHHAYIMAAYGRMGFPPNTYEGFSEGFRCAKSP